MNRASKPSETPPPWERLTPESIARWEPDIRRFEEETPDSPPPEGCILFTGSSSIVFWDSLAEDFPEHPVVNRGFGGSELRHLVCFADRLILPVRPRKVVVYGGSHDLRHGCSPEDVAETVAELARRVRAELPATEIGFLALKPSLKKWDTIGLDRRANELVESLARSEEGIDYIDTWSALFDGGPLPPERFFQPDRNHLSPAGYARWIPVTRRFLD